MKEKLEEVTITIESNREEKAILKILDEGGWYKIFNELWR